MLINSTWFGVRSVRFGALLGLADFGDTVLEELEDSC